MPSFYAIPEPTICSIAVLREAVIKTIRDEFESNSNTHGSRRDYVDEKSNSVFDIDPILVQALNLEFKSKFEANS
jgi:hypothetical protein